MNPCAIVSTTCPVESVNTTLPSAPSDGVTPDNFSGKTHVAGASALDRTSVSLTPPDAVATYDASACAATPGYVIVESDTWPVACAAPRSPNAMLLPGPTGTRAGSSADGANVVDVESAFSPHRPPLPCASFVSMPAQSPAPVR
ncbi:hypothetical protein ACFXPA_44545 [Amycolatopsis sp. NPDC059090]|uniref:hypothetical protein n=1 Tax=unclassified Amycolatopsis TaxID=2618356 RepID=UPI00366E4769